jgi:hypothetical protein
MPANLASDAAATVAGTFLLGRDGISLPNVTPERRKAMVETFGMMLAVDEEARFVALQAVKDIETLTTENFPTLMENFLRVAEEWREVIENFGASVRPADASAEHPFDPRSMVRG